MKRHNIHNAIALLVILMSIAIVATAQVFPGPPMSGCKPGDVVTITVQLDPRVQDVEVQNPSVHLGVQVEMRCTPARFPVLHTGYDALDSEYPTVLLTYGTGYLLGLNRYPTIPGRGGDLTRRPQ